MSKKVLLIDDDKDDAEIFSDALIEMGIDATLSHFDNGLLALETLEQHPDQIPDVIFLDINMPAINGWDCLRKIKELASLGETPIIMYSTYDLEGQGLNAADVGARAFLTKPHRFDELKNKLAALFAKIW